LRRARLLQPTPLPKQQLLLASRGKVAQSVSEVKNLRGLPKRKKGVSDSQTHGLECGPVSCVSLDLCRRVVIACLSGLG
jgi:hypothetical protein